MSPEKSQVEKRENTTLSQTDKKIDAELFSQCFSESLGHDLSFYKDEPSIELTTEQIGENNSALEITPQEETNSEKTLEVDKVEEEEPNSTPTTRRQMRKFPNYV